MSEADRIEREIRAAVAAHPEVIELTTVLRQHLPADLAELVLFDYTCTVRRATVAAVLDKATTGAKRDERAVATDPGRV